MRRKKKLLTFFLKKLPVTKITETAAYAFYFFIGNNLRLSGLLLPSKHAQFPVDRPFAESKDKEHDNICNRNEH